MDVTQVLMNAQSQDLALRQGAEQMLKNAEETNLVSAALVPLHASWSDV